MSILTGRGRLPAAGSGRGPARPLKVLTWEDDKEQVWLARNNPGWPAARHGVTDRAEVIRAITGALDALTDAVTKAAR